MGSPTIPFNKPYASTNELSYIREALASSHRHGDGPFTQRCQALLERRLDCRRVLLTHSCTAALEMAALLAELSPGDEVILPSFTFVSTANAALLRGADLVFVDIDPDTQLISPAAIEAAITDRTRAIVAVHYAGVACDMDAIMALAARHGLVVIEDAAQAYLGTYRGRALGTIGHFGCISFHDSKNISCGEGGALVINDPAAVPRAEIIREKGTNRSQFLRGEVDKYSWKDIGSSFLPSDVTAAFLLGQLEEAEDATRARLAIWQNYHEAFAAVEEQRLCRRPRIPAFAGHNAHIYYLVMDGPVGRQLFMDRMYTRGIPCPFHYVPLHDSSFGASHSRTIGPMSATLRAGECLVRLPIFREMNTAQFDSVVAAAHDVFATEAARLGC